MAYTRLKNNVNAINYAITKNRIGIPTVIDDGSTQTTVVLLAEDLSNFVDVGKAISTLDADVLKSFAKDVVTGIARNEFITDLYTAETHGIVKTVEAYNGAIQRIALKNLPEVQESHARNLINGVNYFDGKFYGMELDAKIFSDEFDFKIPYSIGYEDIRAKFDNIAWVDETIGAIETAVHNSLEIKLKGIADTLLNKAIVDAVAGGRVVHLITAFNTYFGYTSTDAKTLTDIKGSETLMKQFVGFVSLAMGLVKQGMQNINQKYNDGTVPTFTPSNRLQIVGLVEFMRMLNNFGYVNIYHDNDIPRENVHETLCWQTSGNAMLPLMGVTDVIKDGTFTVSSGKVTSETATQTTGVVMFMYDSDSMGVSKNLDKVGVENIGAELYNTYFHHFAIRQYLDKRSCAVAFALD